MNFRQFENLLKKFTTGKSTPEEDAYVLKWFEQIGVDIGADKRHIVQDDEKSAIKKRAWQTLQHRIDVGKYPDQSRRVASRIMAKVAATLLLFFIAISAIYLGDTFFEDDQQLISADASFVHVLNTESVERIVELADGSKVSLRQGSELKYPTHFSKEREVYLVGEAFFDIAHDSAHPFLVHAKEVTTKVLGTSFTIKAYQDQENVTVSVRTGKVIVTAPRKRSKVLSGSYKQVVLLTPNQEVIIDSKTEQMATKLVEKPQIVEVVPSLAMKYSNASAIEILENLQQAYGVPIRFDRQALALCTVTTMFNEEDLYERVNMVCYALGGEYKIENLEIQILAKGCK